MPEINGEGFVICIKKFNEKSLIVKVFSENNGIISGFLKKSFNKQDKYLNQVGNFVNFKYTYKTIDKKGTIQLENIKSYIRIIFSNKINLAIFNSVVALLIDSISENDSVKEIYEVFEKIIYAFNSDDKNLILYYINFLFKIVAYLGMNIDVSKCVVSGVKDVYYMSPKTGNCVSKGVGEKYKDKLFVIPKCFFEDCFDKKEIENSVNILHHFVEKIFKENEIYYKYKNIDFLRKNLIESITST